MFQIHNRKIVKIHAVLLLCMYMFYYHGHIKVENTGFCLITKVKQRQARLVL